jgi:hypothetical protein
MAILCSKFVEEKTTIMKNQETNGNPSTFQELASFLNVLNGNKNSDKPLLKKSESPSRMVYHLEKQFQGKQAA